MHIWWKSQNLFPIFPANKQKLTSFFLNRIFCFQVGRKMTVDFQCFDCESAKAHSKSKSPPRTYQLPPTFTPNRISRTLLITKSLSALHLHPYVRPRSHAHHSASWQKYTGLQQKLKPRTSPSPNLANPH